MRRNVVCIAAGLTALGLAAPASARAFRPDYAAVPMYEARVVALQARINRLAGDNVLPPREADLLRGQAAGLRALVGIKARNGLNTAERIEIDLRISRLARQVSREAGEAEEAR